jgi:hypothetical protein
MVICCCFVMRENFLIIFIQIFLINSLIFSDEAVAMCTKYVFLGYINDDVVVVATAVE